MWRFISGCTSRVTNRYRNRHRHWISTAIMGNRYLVQRCSYRTLRFDGHCDSDPMKIFAIKDWSKFCQFRPNSTDRRSMSRRNDEDDVEARTFESLEDYHDQLRYYAQEARNPHAAERLIIKMEQDLNVRPTVESYNFVIEAWSYYYGSSGANKNQNAVRSERWLRRMKELNPELKPNVTSYNYLLHALSQNKKRKSRNSFEVAKKQAVQAQDILNKMKSSANYPKPNTESYNRVMQAWVQCGEGMLITEKVMSLLKELEDISTPTPKVHSGIIQPNYISYTIAMNAFRVSAAYKLRMSRQPKKKQSEQNVSYDDVMNDVVQVENLISYMNDLSNAGVADVSPDTRAYNSLIAAWAKIVIPNNTESALKAESVLRRMAELRGNTKLCSIAPDQISYNTVIHAWVRVNTINGAKRAEWWLGQLLSDNDINEVEITDVYNNVLKAWSVHDPIKTKALLEEMKTFTSPRGRSISCPPNTESFSVFIGTCVRFSREDKYWSCDDACNYAGKALQELQAREANEELGCYTSTELFNMVLKTSSLINPGTSEAFKLAIDTYKSLKSSRHYADHISYKYMLQIILQSDVHGTKTKSDLIKRFLTMCRDDGLLSKDVIQQVTRRPFNYPKWSIIEARKCVDSLFHENSLQSIWSCNLGKHIDRPTLSDFLVKIKNS